MVKQIVEHIANKFEDVHRVIRTRVSNSDLGPIIYMEVEVKYGCNVPEALQNFKQKAIREIENLTAMNVSQIDVVAKSIYIEK